MAVKKDWMEEGAGYIDVTLSRPASLGGAEVSVIRLRELNGRDMLVSEKRKGTDLEKEFALIADLSGFAPDEIAALPGRDLKRLGVAASSFID